MDETASADAQVHQQRKVKRKAAPVFVPSKIISAPTAAGPAVVDAAAITKSDLPVPLDHKGRPMHRVAGVSSPSSSLFDFDELTCGWR